MGTEEAKQLHKQRAATIETINADLRELRGLDRALSVALWAGVTFSLLRWLALEST